MTVSPGTLRPEFDSGTTEYRAAVLHGVEQVTVTATATEADATVAFQDQTGVALADADTGKAGQQIDVFVGETEINIKVTNGSTTETYTLVVERDSASVFGWTPTDDFNTLEAAGNENAAGMWGSGAILWVSDSEDDKLYAYNLGTKARDEAKDFALHADNADPWGIWSDGNTLWVADTEDRKLYAYTLSSGVRDEGNDITLHTNNDKPRGLWGNATHIYVSDYDHAFEEPTPADFRKLYAYSRSDRTRDQDKEFDLFGANGLTLGIWSDGTTLWAGDGQWAYVFAYTRSTTDRDLKRGFRLQSKRQGMALWSDGTTLWVKEDNRPGGKIYSYQIEPTVAGDTTLRALTISPDVLQPTFAFNEFSYRARMKNSVRQLTVTATANNARSMVTFHDESGAALRDADTGTDGHQVDVPVGGSEINIKITASTGRALTYTVVVERDSDLIHGWTPTKDFNDLFYDGVTSPSGIAGNSTTMWVANYDDDKLYAYTTATGARDSGKDITLATAHPDLNRDPNGLYTDGETMWVSGFVGSKIFAYVLSTGVRDSDKDVPVHADNSGRRGVWSDGTTMWVYDPINSVRGNGRVFAYAEGDGVRQDGTGGTTDKEIELDQDSHGIWSDGTTLWVANREDDKLKAYKLDIAADGAVGVTHGDRDGDKDITLHPDNDYLADIWSDGKTMWVVDNRTSDGKVYAYNMAPSAAGDTTLNELTVTHVDPAATTHGQPAATAEMRPGFRFDQSLYRTAVANSVTQVTITATANDSGAKVAFLDENDAVIKDLDTFTDGLQVNVAVGETMVKIKVTSGPESLIYKVVVERDSIDIYGWTPTRDFNKLTAGNTSVWDAWGNATTLYVAHHRDDKIYAYNRNDGSRNEGKDITHFKNVARDENSNESTRGIWSNGTMLWALDTEDGKLFAYRLSNGNRISGRDIDLDEESNNYVYDIWSDDTTIWVSDRKRSTLFAYRLSNGDRDIAKDIALDNRNKLARGIASDGATMWVADASATRVFAYALATGARDRSKEFELDPDNGEPRGLWIDGKSLWILYAQGKKIYSYNLAPRDPTVSIADGSGTEGGNVKFTVSLSSPSRKTVSVNYRTGRGGDGVRATAGIDYTLARSTLTFAPGETSKTISVAAKDDEEDDPGEVFIVTLSSPTDAELGISRATGTINEGANPSLIIAVRKEGHETNRNVREDGSDHPFYQRTVMVAMYNLEDASWEGRSPADDDFYGGEEAHDHNVDANSLDYVHRLDIKGGDSIGNIYQRTPCEGPRDPIPGKSGTYALNDVFRETWRVNENPETRSSGPVDNGDESDDDGCLHHFTVRATVWNGDEYEAEGTAADPVTTLTCTFKGNDDGSDDFRPLPLDSETYPDRNDDPANYYHAFLVCTDSNRDDRPDNAPALPPLDWEPPPDPGQAG